MPDFVQLYAVVIVLFALLYFSFASIPFLFVRLDVPEVSRLFRGLFDGYFWTVGGTAFVAAAVFAAGGRMAFAAAMLLLPATAMVMRRRVLQRIDTQQSAWQSGDSAAMRRLRLIHWGGMLGMFLSLLRSRAAYHSFFDATPRVCPQQRQRKQAKQRRTYMGRLLWRWWPWNNNKSLDEAELASKRFEGGGRRHLLQAFSAMAAGGALAAISQPTEAKDSNDAPPPRRALTGRDEAGKSVFKSFDVTPKVVEIDSNPGLTFHELYMTEDVPKLTGMEPDPMLTGTKAFPGPGGTMFRLISYPPKRPEGYKPPPGVTFESALKELSEKVPGMGDHFERGAPGMHTSDTIDYAIVVRGEMTLELDDGQKVHLRQGDCVVQNGTRHRWRNPLPEPCLMAFISIGGKRG